MTVTQSTERMVADWNSFSVGANASVNFAQPSAQSVALNRVLGADPSSIQGRLSANGRIFLLNPNGVIFGSSAHVDVGGIVASSQALSNEDFLNGNYRFSNAAGGVLNQGMITAAPQGYVVLSGTTASNEGSIDAAEGTAALVAGESMTLEVGSTGLLSVSVDAATLDALAKNTGVIRADGGVVFMLAESASAVPGMVISAGGTIQAQSIAQRDGKIYLDGGTRGEVYVTGTLDASAETSGSAGASAATAPSANASAETIGSTDASAETSGVHGGDVTVLGQNIGLLADAHIDASGDAGGGTVLIGGNWQGQGPEHNASAVVMDEAATIDASATANGDGGTVVLWSDDYMNFQGSIAARGGAHSGDGGQVETSSKDNLQAFGSVDAAAPLGNAGAWLLDPSDITISGATTSGGTFAGNPSVFTPSSGVATSIVQNSAISTPLSAGTSVTINTVNVTTAGSGSGDITVNNAITKQGSPSTATLTLVAVRNIIVNAPIAADVNSGALNVVLNSNATASGTSGYVNITSSGSVRTNGGTLTIGGRTSAAGNAYGIAAQTAGVYIAGALNTGAGNVIIRGIGFNGGGNGVTMVASGSITTITGNVTINGEGSSTGSNQGIGVYFLNGTLTAGSSNPLTAGGAVAITGTAGNATGTGNTNTYLEAFPHGNVGVSFQGDSVKVTGRGVTITGTGGNGTIRSQGVYWEGSGNNSGGAIDAPIGGNVSITGVGATGTGSGAGIWGIAAWGPLTITGPGTLTLVGTGSPSSGHQNVGVYSNFDGAALTSKGALSITGTGGTGGGNSNSGFMQTAPLTSDGNVTIVGYGGSGAGTEGLGYYTTSDVTSGGAINIQGIAQGTNTRGDGVLITGATTVISTTADGAISISGSGRSTLANRSAGLRIVNAQVISQSGNIALYGFNGGTGSGTGFGTVLDQVVLGNVGVSLEGSAVKVITGGAGAISIEGLGGGGTSSTNSHGVFWETVDAINATGSGAITITGTGGGNRGGAGTGANHYGIAAYANLNITGTGILTMTGSGGTSSGTDNYGLYQGAAIASNGDINLKGTGGNASGILLAHGYYNAGWGVTAASDHHIKIVGIGGRGGGTASSGNGVVLFGAGAVISTTGLGTIALIGEAHSTGANNTFAVRLTSAKVSTEDGAITIKGGIADTPNGVVASSGGTSTSTTAAGSGIGNAGVVVEGAGAKISTSGDGNVSITGTGASTGAGLVNYGVYWEVSAFDVGTTAGTFTIVGIGGNSNGNSNYGVKSVGAMSMTNGNLSITGTGGTGSGASNYGVQTAGITTNGGNIFMQGTGGAGTGSGNVGFRGQFAAITSNGGNITLVGIGSGTGTLAHGYSSASSFTVTASNLAVGATAGGNISITGTAASGATGANDGIQLNTTSAITTNFGGTVTLLGTAYGTADTSRGVHVAGAVTAVDGLIKITGTNSSTSVAASNSGVLVTTGGSVVTNGSGGVTLVGFGGGSGAGGGVGVYLAVANAVRATLTNGLAPITITGTGGGATIVGTNSSTSNQGVHGDYALAGNGGPIFIKGTGGNTSGTGNVGIAYDAAITNTIAGSITIEGTGGGTGQSENGYVNAGFAVTSVSGHISITGTGAGSSGFGVSLAASSTVTTGGDGNITITGTGISTGAAAVAGLRNRGTITAATGKITLVGNANGTGTGTATTANTVTVGNIGVWLDTAANSVRTTGGEIDITGTAALSTASSALNLGVYWEVANSIQVGDGLIKIIGTGGAGSGATNYGVYANAALGLTGNGSINIEGTGGAGSGASNYGFYQNAALTTVAGDITLKGTGGATGNTAHGYYNVGYGVSSSASGDITITGTGRGTSAYGVNLRPGSAIGTAGYTLITGTGSMTATSGSNHGVYLSGANAIQGSGEIKIIGIGGTGSGTSYGVMVNGALTLPGTSSLTIEGTGGGVGGQSSYGFVQVAAITNTGSATNTGAGDITLKGTATDTGLDATGIYLGGVLTSTVGRISLEGIGSGLSGNGIYQSTADLMSTGGTGTITLKGTGSSSGTNYAYGVRLFAPMTTLNGLIKITGDFAGLAGSGGSGTRATSAPNNVGNVGVLLEGATAKLSTTGSVTTDNRIEIVGTGGVGTAGASNYGVLWEAVDAIKSTGRIDIKGTGGSGSGGTNYGVFARAALTLANASSITIDGTGGSGGGGNNYGLYQNAAITSTGTGAITLKGTGGGTATLERGYYNFAQTVSSGSGNISITGVGAGRSGVGVYLDGAVISTAGAITINGTGSLAGGTSAANYGVTWGGANAFQGGGVITIVGTGGFSSGNTNYGVLANGPLTLTGASSITIEGTGGSGGGANNYGHYQNDILTTASGNINLKGTGGGSGTGLGAAGVYLGGYAITSSTGNIIIDGTGAGPSGHGIYQTSANYAISTAGVGTITLTGTGSSSGTTSAYGVRVLGPITTVDGLIKVTGSFAGTPGLGGSGTITTAAPNTIGNVGVLLEGPSAKLSTIGSVITAFNGIQVDGTGGGSSGVSNYGVFWEAVDAIKSTIRVNIKGTGGASSGNANYGVFVNAALSPTVVTSSVTIDGTGGSGIGNTNYGVYLNAALTTSGGAINIKGTGGIGIGSSNFGIYQVAALASNGGAITLEGIGGTGVDAPAARGYVSSSTSSTVSAAGTNAGGVISIKGTGGPNSPGGFGIDLFGPVTTSHFGAIELIGVSHSSGAVTPAAGVRINNVAVTAVNGPINVIGSFSAGVGGTASRLTTLGNLIGNVGVLIEGASGKLTTTGSGRIEVEGAGGGSTVNNNYGVFWETATSIVTGTNASITLKGTGGGTGSSTDNYGVYAKTALNATGTGFLSIEGIGGSSAGANNYGILQAGAFTTTGGNITIRGTGGAGVGAGGTGYVNTAFNVAAGGGGSVAITGIAGASTAQGYGIQTGAALISASVAGTITLTGTGHSTGTNNAAGVRLQSGKVLAVNGAISITGNFSGTAGSGVVTTVSGTAASVGNVGVLLEGGSARVNTTGTGSITLHGTGGAGDGGNNFGVFWESGSPYGIAAGGAITIEGTGGGNAGAGGSNVGVFGLELFTSAGLIHVTGFGGNSTGTGNYGIRSNGIVTNIGAGGITLEGTGGGTGNDAAGFYNGGFAITALGGDVSITGTGGANAASGSGVVLSTGAAVSTTDLGKITIAGIAHNKIGGTSSIGASIGGSVSAVTGLISITGNSSGSVTENSGNIGVLVGGVVGSTGAGGILVTGTGGGAGTGGSNHGVSVTSTGGFQSVGAATIEVIGTAGGGTGGANTGIVLGGAVTAAGAGHITLTGTGGVGAASDGITVTGNSVTSQGGNVAINGDAKWEGTGTGSGIRFGTGSGSFTTIGNGTMTVLGTARGSSAGVVTSGVSLEAAANVISTVNGALIVTGTNVATAGVTQTGVSIATGAQIKSTGNGTVAVFGTSGFSADVGNHGVKNNGTISVANGALSITGHGRADGASGVLNLGGAIRSTGTGSISISATRIGPSAAAFASSGVVSGATASSDVVIIAQDVSLSLQGIQTAGSITFLPGLAGATTVSIGAGTGALHLDDTELGLLSWGAAELLTIGGDYAGDLNVSSTVTFAGPVWFSNAPDHDITISGTLASTALANSVVLASGRHFLGGNITVPVGGRYLVYSLAAVRNTEGSLGGTPTRVYNKTISNYAPGSVTEAGNAMLYRSFGAGTITITAENKSRVYGAADVAFTHVFACLPSCTEGDSLATLPELTSNASITSDVGSSYVITAANAAVNDLYSGYAIVYAPGAHEITPAPLTVINTAVVSKVYNALLDATFSAGELSGVLNSDPITLNRSGTFATKTAGLTKAVITTFTLGGGAKANNYTLTQPTVTGEITRRALTVVSGISATSRAYDATTVAGLSGGVLSALQQTDAVTLVSGPGTFDTKDVGTAKPIVATGYSLTGADSANYTLTLPTGITADITKKALTIGISVANKQYDGGTTATVSGTPTLNGVLNSEAVTLGAGAVAFATKSAGATKAVDVTGYTIIGADIGNYSLTLPTGITAPITQKPVTVSVQGTVRKTYDGNGVATLAPSNFAITGLIGSDDVTVSNTTGMYSDKNADTGKTVTVATVVTTGIDAGNYNVVASATGNVGQIDKAAVTITATSLGKIYGAADPAFTYTNTALVGADTTSVFSGALARAAGENVTTYGINRGLLAAQNYEITFVPGVFTIGKALLTVTAENKNKSFGAADPALTYTSVGLAARDDAVTTITGVPVRAPGESVAGNPYAITKGSVAATANYNLVFVDGVFTINGAPLTIIAANTSKTYGAADPAFLYSVSGLAPADTAASVLTGALARANTSENVLDGPFAIGQGNLLASGNYSINFTPAQLTINPAALVVTASPASKIYGAADPALTFTDSGRVHGDTSSIYSGALAITGVHANVGAYPITRGTLTPGGNYAVTFNPGTLTISQKAINVIAANSSKIYGATEPILTYTNDALIGADVLSGALHRVAGEHASTYAIDKGTLDGGGNYDLIFAPGHFFTIDKAPLTINAVAGNKVYGDPDPALTYAAVGLVNSDTDAIFSGSLTRAVNANVGAYPIAVGTLSTSSPDYTVTYNSADFTITPKPMTVTADAKGKDFGSVDPLLTYSHTPLVNGDTNAVFAGALARDIGESVVGSPYLIRQGGLNAGANYSISYASASFIISEARLVINAEPKTKIYGETDPVLTYNYSGLLVGDAIGDKVSGGLARDAGTDAAVYAINQGDLVSTDSNYVIDFFASTFTIAAKPITVTPDSLSKVYGTAEPSALTYTHDALVGADAFTGALSRDGAENAGVYKVNLNTLDLSDNYDLIFTEDRTFTIDKAPLTVTASPASKTYGAADPALLYTHGTLVNSDSAAAVFSGSLARVVGETVASGPYAINQDSLSAGANYTITYTGEFLTIEPAALAVTANVASKTYGTLDPAFTYNVIGLANGDVTVPLSGTLDRDAGADAGTYGILQGTVASTSTNYSIAYTSADFTIDPAALTVVAAPQTKIYGASDPTLSYSVSGLVNGDASTVVTGLLDRAAGENVVDGPFAIGRGALTAGGNYTIAFTPNSLVITPKTLAVTAANTGKVYGAAEPSAFTYTNDVLVSPDTISIFTGELARAPGEERDVYAIGQGTLSAGTNYSIAFTPGAFTISNALLAIIANSGQSKVYGGTEPTLTYTATGFLPGEDDSLITGLLARAIGTDVGLYPINVGSLLAPNYDISFTAANLEITPATLTITANDLGKTYGGVDPALTYRHAGLVNGDTASIITGAAARATGAAAGTYAINVDGVAATPNYTLSRVAGVFTIDPAALTLTANNLNKIYGVTDPTLTVSATGLVNGDTLLTAVTGTPVRGTGADVGTYPITRNDVLASANYTVTFVDGVFTINPAALTLTANNSSKVYGAVDPTLTLSATGLTNGDTLLTAVTGTPVRVAGETVADGPYAITRNNVAASANYTVTFVDGLFTIDAAPLTITATSSSKVYGAADPTLTVSAAGFVGADTLSNTITGTPVRAAGETVADGPYAITRNNVAASTNYAVTFVDGLFTINPAALTLTANSLSKTYGAADPTLTVSAVGLVGTDTLSNTITGTPVRVAGETVVSSPYAITRNNVLASANYTVTFVDGLFAINPAPLTLTANNLSKTYGATDPTLTLSAAGLMGTDTLSNTITGAPVRVAGESVADGPYAITRNDVLATSNYTVTFVDGLFTIGAAPLMITANNASKIYGAGDPALTMTAVGLMGTDTSSNTITGAVLRAAGETVAGGPYAITRNDVLATSNYAVTFVDGVFTINPAALTLTANNLNKIYGAADPVLTVSAVGLVGTDTLLDTITGTPARAVGETVAGGPYAITRNTVLATPNYAVTFIDGLFAINPAALTLTANNSSKVYGAADPTLTLTAVGLVGTDTLSNTITGTPVRVAGETVAGGPYGITRNDVLATPNYAVTFVDGLFAINPAALTLTANNSSKVYGAGDPALTLSAVGLAGTDTLSNAVTGTPLRAAGETVAGGPYAITRNDVLASANYAVTFVDGLFTITPAALAVAAHNQSKAFGAVDPALTYGVTGLQGSDTTSVLTGALARAPGADKGSYAIGLGSLSVRTNYTIGFTPATFTISNALLSIVAAAQAKIYGDADPTLGYSVTGFQGTDSPSLLTGALARALGENVGSYPITVGTLSAGANYAFDFTGDSLTIGVAPLTVNATALSKVYGTVDPALTYTSSGLKLGESAANIFSGNLSRIAGDGVGAHAITQNTLLAGGNYAIDYNPESLTVTPKPITVTANPRGKDLGDTDPAFTYTHSTLGYSDGAGVFSGALARVPGETPGSYPITQSTLSAGANYTINYVGNPLTITEDFLVISADPKDKIYGDGDPALTYTYSGLEPGDDPLLIFSGSLDRAPGNDVSAVPYAIGQGSLTATGYTIQYYGSALAIAPKAIAVTAIADSKGYGTVDPTLTYTHDPLIAGDDPLTLFTGNLSRPASENVSTYSILQNTLSAGGNYTLSYTGSTFAITPATLAIALAAQTKIYGDADPAPTYAFGGFAFADSAFVLTGNLVRAPGETVGLGPYAITRGSLGAGSNYSVDFTGNDLTITQRALSIVADASTKTYGDTDPAQLSYTVANLANGDTSSVITGDLARVAGENAGAYAISQNSLAAGTNYQILYTPADFIVNRAAIDVLVDAHSKVYGDADPTFTYDFSGLTSTDAALLPTGALARTAGENVDAYAITQGTLDFGGNYAIDYTGNMLTVSPRALTVTTDSATQTAGDASPAFTGGDNLTTADATLISWLYGPVGFSGATGNYVIDARATDPNNLLANYVRTNAYGSLTVLEGLIPEVPTTELNFVRPVVGNRNRIDSDARGAIPALWILNDGRSADFLTFNSATAPVAIPVSTLSVLPPVSVTLQTLAPAQTFTNVYSDGSTSNTTLVEVAPGLVRMRVSETDLNVMEEFSLSAGNSAGGITVVGEGSDIAVTMDDASTVPQSETVPGAGVGQQLAVQMAGSAGHAVEFAVSVDGDALVIQPTGATAAAIFAAEPDGALLTLVMAQAIVTAVSKLEMTQIPAIRLLR